MPWQRPKERAQLGAKAANPEAAMDALARLLAGRERSVQEACGRLAEKGYEPDTIAEVLGRAQACGLLDDERFASHYINDKLRVGWGQRRIAQELRRFGIDAELVGQKLEASVDDGEQLANAIKLLDRHHSRSKNPRQAAYSFLAGKGYSSDVIRQAIDYSVFLSKGSSD